MAVTPVQRRRIKEEAGYKCGVPTCNNTSPLEIHHIIHQESGGPDTDENLICLCRNCHGRYHDGEIDAVSINAYKQRLRRVSADLAPHEYIYLERLHQGEIIELDDNVINLARGLERRGLITITDLANNQFRLALTQNGEDFIE